MPKLDLFLARPSYGVYDRLPKRVRARLQQCHYNFPDGCLRGLKADEALRVIEIIDRAASTGDNLKRPDGTGAIAALKEAGYA